jgi:hypothetical protein
MVLRLQISFQNGFISGLLFGLFISGLLCGLTLSRFLLEFDAKRSRLFEAAVQFFKQDRDVMWNTRSHRYWPT